jgi:hypothetical protein
VDKHGDVPEHPNQRLYDKHTGRLVQDGLSQFVKMWPTPNVPNGGRSPKPGTVGPTGMMVDGKKRQVDLQMAVRMWPTPMSAPTSEASHGQFSGQYRQALKDSGIENSGQLNPTWVEWLMGFPLGWTDCEDSETLSSRKSQNGSADGSLKVAE